MKVLFVLLLVDVCSFFSLRLVKRHTTLKHVVDVNRYAKDISSNNRLLKFGLTSMLSFCVLSNNPSNSFAVPIEPQVTVETIKQDGGIDAFEAALNANSFSKMKSLSNTVYKQAQEGLIPLSQEPRAVKRRVTAACKNADMLKLVSPPITSYDCMTRVMKGDIKFMADVLKDLPNDKVMPLMKSYGSPP